MNENTITLYFGLKENEKADLEVVAEAALKWVIAMRAAAREFDPEANFRVELVDIQEGSLKLNTILDWAEEQLSKLDEGSGKYWRLRKLAIALSVFVVFTGVPTYDFYFGEQPEAQLSQEDRELLQSLIERLGDNFEFQEKKRRFYKEIERDNSIVEVGVSESRDSPPVITVPSDQFPEQSGLWALQEDSEVRTSYEELDVTLVAPMLVSKKRSWKFDAEGRGEFSAIMGDEEFLKALETDHVKERLRVGIQMKIRMKVDEEKIGGAWTVKRRGRVVVKVIEPDTD